MNKESRRWLSGAQTAGEVLAQAAEITVVADRESDIYDEFARRPANVHLLTRLAQDRALVDGGGLIAFAAEPCADQSPPPLPSRRQNLCPPPTLCYNARMSDLPATAALHRAPSHADSPALGDALGASAFERLAPVLVALLCLWGLVYWALR
jgi:hypothetical protein